MRRSTFLLLVLQLFKLMKSSTNKFVKKAYDSRPESIMTTSIITKSSSTDSHLLNLFPASMRLEIKLLPTSFLVVDQWLLNS